MSRRLLAISLLALVALVPGGCGGGGEESTGTSTTSTTETAASPDEEPQAFFGFLKMKTAKGGGAEVLRVEQAGPVGLAGLRRGDVIVAVKGQPVADGPAAAAALEEVGSTASAGDELEIEVERGSEQATLKVLLLPNIVLGVEVQEAKKGKPSLIARGVAPGSAAKEAGVKPGDVVTSVDGEPVTTVVELYSELGTHVPGDEVQLTVERDGSEQTLTITARDRTLPPQAP